MRNCHTCGREEKGKEEKGKEGKMFRNWEPPKVKTFEEK